MIIRLIGCNNETLEEIDTTKVKHCVGVTIEHVPDVRNNYDTVSDLIRRAPRKELVPPAD